MSSKFLSSCVDCKRNFPTSVGLFGDSLNVSLLWQTFQRIIQGLLFSEGLNYTMICRGVCKCEPLLRFNPLNLAKIVCFAKWVKGAKCVSSDFLNEKVLLVLTCIILKIKAQLK